MDDIPKKRKLFLSIISGEIYEIDEDEIKNLDAYQIPLKQRPNSSCKKCYGRGYIGFNIITKSYELCRRCGRKIIDFDFLHPKPDLSKCTGPTGPQGLTTT